MTQRSPSTKLESTWGNFFTKQAVEETQTKLKEANITTAKIIFETEYFQPPVKLENTEAMPSASFAIANLKIGAIAGGV